jgi:hypothetical protein
LYIFQGNSVIKPFSSKVGHMFTFLKVKHQYSGSKKYIKALIVKLCMDTFVISAILLYFLRNLSLRMLFICKMSFFKLFMEQLSFLMGDNLLLSSLKQFPTNNYRDSKSNSYSTKVISLMVAILSTLSPAIHDAFKG